MKENMADVLESYMIAEEGLRDIISKKMYNSQLRKVNNAISKLKKLSEDKPSAKQKVSDRISKLEKYKEKLESAEKPLPKSDLNQLGQLLTGIGDIQQMHQQQMQMAQNAHNMAQQAHTMAMNNHAIATFGHPIM